MSYLTLFDWLSFIYSTVKSEYFTYAHCNIVQGEPEFLPSPTYCSLLNTRKINYSASDYIKLQYFKKIVTFAIHLIHTINYVYSMYVHFYTTLWETLTPPHTSLNYLTIHDPGAELFSPTEQMKKLLVKQKEMKLKH